MTKRQSSPDEIAASKKVEASPAPQKAMEKAGVGGCDRFQPLLGKYDWDVRIMKAIMQAESSCNENSTGDSHNPEVNIDCAYHVWKSQGYKAWSVYTNGRYLRFL